MTVSATDTAHVDLVTVFDETDRHIDAPFQPGPDIDADETPEDAAWLEERWQRFQAKEAELKAERAARAAENVAIVTAARAGNFTALGKLTGKHRWDKHANDNHAPGIDAETLLGMEFEPIKYVVPGYVAEGLTLLGGRPKLGKSWLALDFGIAVASGGVSLGAHCEPGDAVYLALEDNQRRLQDRLRLVLPAHGRPNLSRLTLLTEAPKINAGLIDRLDAWRKAAENPRLVIVDTLAMVRPPKGKNQDSYAADYDALSPLQRWAGEHRLAVVVVTHVRKMEADDPLEMISGTNGLTGAADSILILNRTADGPKLYGRGRDVEEVEKVLHFNSGRWSVLGGIEEVKRSDERREIIDVLASATKPLKPADIAKTLGKATPAVSYLLRQMVKSGEATKVGYGEYLPVVNLSVSSPSSPSTPSSEYTRYSPSSEINHLGDGQLEGLEGVEGGYTESDNLDDFTPPAFLRRDRA